MAGEAEETQASQGLCIALLGLAAAVLALVVRFALAGDASLTYNEATYAELAAHPWVSSFYPDTVFLRHPPLAFALLWLWTGIFGTAEWVMRLPALIATLAGVALLWDAARRAGGTQAALIAGLVFAAGYPLHAYALQVGMYPYAFLAMALAVWAHVLERPRLLLGALVMFALTHLFGFLFLVLALAARSAPDRRLGFAPAPLPVIGRGLLRTWPAWLWLASAGLLGLLVNADGDIMRLGPFGQAVRSGATAGDAVAGRPLVHAASAGIAIWSLNIVLAVAAWRKRRAWLFWALGAGVLIAYLPFAAPFPRYALLILPPIVVAGAAALRDLKPGWGAAAVLVALTSIPVGFAYIEEGPDPRAAGDVPGVQDWAGAVAALEETGFDRVASSGPLQTAYYLLEAGHHVRDRSEGPYVLELGGPRDVTVLRIDSSKATVEADAWIVPVGWEALHERLAGQGFGVCAEPDGLRVYHASC